MTYFIKNKNSHNLIPMSFHYNAQNLKILEGLGHPPTLIKIWP